MIFLLLLELTFTELMSLDLKQLITVMNIHQYLKYVDLKKAKRQLIKGLIKKKYFRIFFCITTAKIYYPLLAFCPQAQLIFFVFDTPNR